jgi:leucyl aminopeptidase
MVKDAKFPATGKSHMPLELVEQKAAGSLPVHLVGKGGLAGAGLTPHAMAWAEANRFSGESGRLLPIPGEAGAIAGALFGLGDGGDGQLAAGGLAKALPDGDWHLASISPNPQLTALGLLLGGYSYTRYGKKPAAAIRFALPEGADPARARRVAYGVNLARDLVNTPTNDLGPDDLERAVRELAARHKAKVSVISGDALLEANFPMIHAVGRAAAQAPRLIDMAWGRKNARRVTLVGKGVCFDTGGLDIKPSSGMLMMKKDMGGAATALAAAQMICDARLPVRLRVLVPAVENSISGSAFRPGDVLKSRKGLTIEIGNTDAEGRLILADALALADEEEPELLIDFATLTGAARVALGPELPPLYSDDDGLAVDLMRLGLAVNDPVWRLPLWRNYDAMLDSKVADINNTGGAFAGSVTAALFLRRFVEKAKAWAHFDVYNWIPSGKPGRPDGGEVQAARLVFALLQERYPAK